MFISPKGVEALPPRRPNRSALQPPYLANCVYLLGDPHINVSNLPIFIWGSPSKSWQFAEIGGCFGCTPVRKGAQRVFWRDVPKVAERWQLKETLFAKIKQHYDAEDLPYFYSIGPEKPKALVVRLLLNITLT